MSRLNKSFNALNGFTMIELMAGLVILMVGLLGFSSMTIMMMKGNQASKNTDEAATLAQSAVEDISTTSWDNLGTDTSMPSTRGLANAAVRTETPINRNAEYSGTGTGPYIYNRHTVVCFSTHTTVAGASPDACASSIGDSNRPAELACNGLGLTAREKLIRIIVSWRDRSGTCKIKHINSLAFQ